MNKRFGLAAMLAGTLASTHAFADVEPRTTVLVHLEARGATQLQHRPEGGRDWTFACASPCDRDLSLGGEYRAVYADGDPSATFRLNAGDSNRLTLTVKQRSTAGLVGAAALFGASTALGVVSYFLVDVMNSVGDYRALSALLVAVITIGGSAATGLSGGLLLHRSLPKLSQEPGISREATWRAPHVVAQGGASLVLPLSFSF